MLEEITSSLLIPLAQKHGIADPHILYELSADEGGKEARLFADFRTLAASGISNDEIDAAADEMSAQILMNTVSELSSDAPGTMHLVIR